MERMSEGTQICYAILRGKANQQLFEEEIQKMKVLDVAASIRKDMEPEVRVLAYCVLDNELHLVLQSAGEATAEKYLDRVIRRYEETCIPENDTMLRIDYLPDTRQFPEVNSSVHEQGIVYGISRKTTHFRKNTMHVLKDMKAALRCCMKLHMLPVKEQIVSAPEDYWWCSYPDYLGRCWLPLTSTGELLGALDENEKQAQKMIRQKHLDALAKLSPGN
ncbi:hypothetical protein NQ534_13675 [Marvinbryantia formatexigens DSM 14469]|nr:hypothetical protein [Marvinbryantia formatexigens]UWO23497.1 hypothetical protein NQ534_13675 [Marvinbryantia formatexigens DSM 14469]SDG56363.1 hypothetical protein SAMN05660368_02814 [Marvinbryantia formatexigens]